MKHDWRQVTLVQTPPRYKCRICSAIKRWNRLDEVWTFYRHGVGFVGRRSPKCEPATDAAVAPPSPSDPEKT